MTVTVVFTPRHWIDASGCHILYSKKFEISAYGRTKKSAEKMFKEQVEQFLLETKPKK